MARERQDEVPPAQVDPDAGARQERTAAVVRIWHGALRAVRARRRAGGASEAGSPG